MRNSQLERWVKRILETEEKEISCSECFDLVSVYVDEELAGKAGDSKWHPIRQHLSQCQACQDEYEILRELASQDASSADQ